MARALRFIIELTGDKNRTLFLPSMTLSVHHLNSKAAMCENSDFSS